MKFAQKIGAKGGYREDIGCYVRSGWEHVTALHLKQHPDIINWEYEPDEIDLHVKRNRYYVPDFLVEWRDGRVQYIEVKGYFAKKGDPGRTKIKRFLLQYDYDLIFVSGKRTWQSLQEYLPQQCLCRVTWWDYYQIKKGVCVA